MAIRYFKSGGTAWNFATSWASTIGGTDNAGVPTSADDVTFDSASASSCPIGTTAGVCKTLTCTGYLGTITTNVTLTISGNVTLGTGSTHSGSSAMIINASATLTSNGNSRINCPVTFNNPPATNNTYTLADDWTMNALFSTTANAGALTHTINGNNIYCKAGILINGASNSSTTLTTGTTTIHLTGTGSVTVNGTSAGLGNNLTFNATGATITLPANIYYRTGTMKYIAGTLTTACNLIPTSTSLSMDMNAGLLNYATPFSVFNNNPALSPVITLLSDWYLSGITNTGSQTTTINGFSLYTTGTILSQTAGILTGSSVLRLKGTVAGQTASSTSAIGMDISIESGSNVVNLGSMIYTPRSGGSTFTYVNGTVNHTGTMTINGPNPVTLNTAGITWNNITFSSSSFITTLSSLLTVTGTITFSTNNYTFAGSTGFTCGTLTWNTLPATINTGIVLSAGVTYTVTSSLNLYSTSSTTYLGIKSGTTGSATYLKLNQGASQSVGFIRATDIDSSGGQTIWAFLPNSNSNTVNWNSLSAISNQLGDNSTYCD